MDFTAELTETPDLGNFLRDSINKHSLNVTDPLLDPACPPLDRDFSKFIILNGLPARKPETLQKLNDLLTKLFNEKLKVPLTEENIEHAWDDAHEKTTGICFIQLKSEDQAKISAQQVNGWALSSKIIISASTFPEYEKMINS
jgi:hypothetical protein